MNAILKDPAKNEFLIREGYVVLPMLNAAEVKLLRDLYDKWHPTPPGEFYKSYFSPNEEYKYEIEELTQRLFRPKMEEHFLNYLTYGCMLVVKPSGPEGDFPPHQDWTFVDESQNWSLNMWGALEDVSGANGNMQMLPRSHKFAKTIRGSGTPDQYASQRDLIQQYVIDVPMQAGDAIFFFHNTLHGSSPNRSGRPRIAIGMSVIEKEVPINYYYQHTEGQVEKFVVDVDFYINYVSHRENMPANAKSLGFINYTFPVLDDAVLIEMIKKAQPERFASELQSI